MVRLKLKIVKGGINADCNGGNIIIKVVPNAFVEEIQGVVIPPVRITPDCRSFIVNVILTINKIYNYKLPIIFHAKQVNLL